MRSFIVAFVVGLCLAVVAAEPLKEREGFYYEQRPRLGHFREEPFTDLYKAYATAFVLPKFKDRAHDDFRNYLPSADECVVFFRKYRIDDYQLRDLDDFVVLDACLGYLYESTYQEVDKEQSQNVAENLDALLADEKLKETYDNAKLDQLSPEGQDCVADLFYNVIRAKAQFPEDICNNHWIDVYLKFAACHTNLTAENRESSVYVRTIFDLVKQRGKACFDAEISSLNYAIRTDYANNPFRRVQNKLSFRKLHKQAHNRIWPAPIVELLSAVQNTDQEINLREVHGIIRGIGLNKPNFKNRLLNNLAQYADRKIKPKKTNKEQKEDPSGLVRYDKLIDNLCNFFRTSDSENYYDFTTPFVRMINILKYPEVFDINENYFIEHVLKESHETGPLYLSVSSCNLLTFTEGSFIEKPSNGPLKYKVVFKRDTSKMIQWPDAGFF